MEHMEQAVTVGSRDKHVLPSPHFPCCDELLFCVASVVTLAGPPLSSLLSPLSSLHYPSTD